MAVNLFLIKLVYIINNLGRFSNYGTKNIPLDADRLSKWKKKVFSRTNVGNVIDLLKEELENAGDQDLNLEPYLHIFLSYAYFIQGNGNDALDNAELAIEKFGLSQNNWDKALAHWFSGIVNQRYPRSDAKKEFYEAIDCLNRFAESNADRDNKIRSQCDSVIAYLKYAVENLPDRNPNYSNSAKRSRKYEVDVLREMARQRSGDDGGVNGTNNIANSAVDPQRPMNINNINIHIPVDIDLNDRLDFTPEINQYAKLDSEPFQFTSNPLDIDLLNLLSSTTGVMELNLHHTNGNGALPKDQKDSDEVKELLNPSNVLTPSFPIYGKATTGPDGSHVLDKPNYSGALNEALLIRLGGKGHKIYPIETDDYEICISTLDYLTSILPPKIAEQLKLKGRRYGWFKVTNNSLNNAGPIPIESDDYVLFYENHDPLLFINKIIVASLPDQDLNTYRLVIKRLVRVDDVHPDDNTGEKQKIRLSLRSESIFDVDPVTKEDYKTDIELVIDEQIMGPVIAVASVKEKKVSE